MTQRIIIIGGGAAGPKTAAKLKRQKPEYIIDLYTQEDMVSYSACGLPYFIEGLIDDYRKLIIRTPEKFAQSGINIHLNQECIDIIPGNKEVFIKNLLTGEEYSECYDILVIATGARPFVPPIENVELGNVFVLRTIHDGVKIKEAVANSKTATIIGGGYIAVELLEAFVKNMLKVNIIEINKEIMSIFDEEMSELIRKHILNKDGDKVNIITSDSVIRLEGEDGLVKKVITANGKEIETDFVIVAAGVVPNSELAKKIGLKLGIKNTIWVGSNFQTSYPGIYAAGDCIEKNNIITRKPCWVPLGSTANKEGRCAAVNISGENCDFDGILGSAVTKYFGFTMSLTGLTEREARALGYDVESTIVTKKAKAGYMPEVENVTIKLVVDRNSHDILGAQAIGCGDADKRINAVSSAILSSTKIDEFLNLDLPYAPPYSPAIDPLLNAAQIIYDRITDNTSY